MKICPRCGLRNEDSFTMCLSCDAVLPRGDLPPLYDPNREQEERETLWKERRATMRNETRAATICYALAITLTAAVPGCVFAPSVLALYFAGALVVMGAVHYRIAGQLTASIFQAALSGTLVTVFGPVQPFTFFMFPAHVILAMVTWHWLNLITDAHR